MRPPLVSRAPMLVKINVTPIIDVALVLVIILLVTAPMLTLSDLEVRLPSAFTRDLEEPGYVSVTIGRDGRIAVEDHAAALVEDVAPLLRARLASLGRPDALVVVRADAGLPHGLVRRVLEEARTGGAMRLAIATRQRGGERP
jgi:biopolymer transport protein TolR